jgi:hypothetical protein
MRAGLSLCPHLAALAPGAAPPRIAPDEVFDWYDGPVEAVVRCPVCGACGWLELLDWDPAQRVRIFALAAIRGDDVALYLRDRARGSCDVARARAELEALAASAGPFERLIALALPELRVVAAVPLAAAPAVPAAPWAERIPPADDDRWFARLGLAKGAPR